MTLLALLFACTTGALDSVSTSDSVASTDTSTGDSAEDTGQTDVDTGSELNGHWAAERTPAPEFVATNRDGTGRSRPDLVGHPTAIWFYPAATTSG